VELLKLVRSATGVPNLDVDVDIMDVIENGCEDVRHAQRLFAEVGLGGRKVWILMESMADAEEDLYGRHHELLLKVSAGALDRRVERLQQLMNGWTQSQIQEGLSLHLTTAAEALAWCQNRLDNIHEEYPPRSGTPGISHGDWELQLRDTAFSPKRKSQVCNSSLCDLPLIVFLPPPKTRASTSGNARRCHQLQGWTWLFEDKTFGLAMLVRACLKRRARNARQCPGAAGPSTRRRDDV